MKRQNMGEQLGEVDGDGIAEWYPNCTIKKYIDAHQLTYEMCYEPIDRVHF